MRTDGNGSHPISSHFLNIPSHSHCSSHVTRMLPDTPTSLSPQTAPNFFLLILPLVLLTLLPSVSTAAHFPPANQVFPPLISSPLYFHPHVPRKHADFPSRPSPFPDHVTKSQHEEMPRPSHLVGTLPSLLYTEPHSANWIIFGQENLRTFSPHFNNFQPGIAVRGQRRPSCTARLKSSAFFSAYGNAIFQVFFCSFFLFTAGVNFFGRTPWMGQ